MVSYTPPRQTEPAPAKRRWNFGIKPGFDFTNLIHGAALINRPGGAANLPPFFAQQEQNRIQRQLLEERQKRQDAMAKVPGLLDSMGVPEEQKPLLGLLADADPERFTQSLMTMMLTPQREKPADIRIMEALGLKGQEGFAKLQAMKGAAEGGDVEAMSALFGAYQQLVNLREDVRKDQEGQTEREQDTRRDQLRLRRGSESLLKLAEINDRLSRTVLQTGAPVGNLRRSGYALLAMGGEMLGMNQDDKKKLIADYDELSKGLEDLIIDQQARFGETITNSMLASLQRANANPNIAPAAINSILADMAQGLMDEASVIDYELPNQKEVAKFIESGGSYRPNQAEPVINAPQAIDTASRAAGDLSARLQDASIADMEALDFSSMNEADLQAVIDRSRVRMRQLGAAGKKRAEALIKKAEQAMQNTDMEDLVEGVTIKWLDSE